MKPVLTNIRLAKYDFGVEIILDWSDDFHRSIKIQPPCTKENVADALRNLSILTLEDYHSDEMEHHTCIYDSAMYPEICRICGKLRRK